LAKDLRSHHWRLAHDNNYYWKTVNQVKKVDTSKIVKNDASEQSKKLMKTLRKENF